MVWKNTAQRHVYTLCIILSSFIIILSNCCRCCGDNNNNAPILSGQRIDSSTPPISQDPYSIILLHGLGSTSKCFAEFQEMIKILLPQAQFFSCDVETSSLSIEDQADYTIQEIQKLIESSHSDTDKEKERKGNKIIIVGHSQGGLRALKLVRLLRKDKKHAEKNGKKRKYALDEISQVITIGSPWKGFYPFDQKIPYIKNVIKLITNLDISKKLPGVDELLAKPKNVEHLADLLKSESPEVIITLIGCVLELKPPREDINKILTKDPNGKHDGCVALDSQLATGVNSPRLHRIAIYNAMHTNLSDIPLISRLDSSLKNIPTELTSPDVAYAVAKAIHSFNSSQK